MNKPVNVRCLLLPNGGRTPYAIGQLAEVDWRVLHIISPMGAFVTLREVYPNEGDALTAASSLCLDFKGHFPHTWAQTFKEMYKGTFMEVSSVR